MARMARSHGHSLSVPGTFSMPVLVTFTSCVTSDFNIPFSPLNSVVITLYVRGSCPKTDVTSACP